MDGVGTVEDDEVGALSLEFLKRPHPMILRLQGEGNDPLLFLDRTAQGNDIGSLDKMELERIPGFGQFVGCHTNRTIIARGGSPDHSVHFGEQVETGLEHILGGDNRNDLSFSGVVDIDGPTDDHDFMACIQIRVGQGLSHSTAGGICQISYRVEVLPSRSRGDQNSSHRITIQDLAAIDRSVF